MLFSILAVFSVLDYWLMQRSLWKLWLRHHIYSEIYYYGIYMTCRGIPYFWHMVRNTFISYQRMWNLFSLIINNAVSFSGLAVRSAKGVQSAVFLLKSDCQSMMSSLNLPVEKLVNFFFFFQTVSNCLWF